MQPSEDRELCVLNPWRHCDMDCLVCPDRERQERIWAKIEAELNKEEPVKTMLDRIVEARLEFVALTNAAVITITQFGASVTDEQQVAITGLVNAVFILGWRLVKGKPAIRKTS